MCIGDFNAIIQSTKKLSKRPSQMSQIDSFWAALKACQLEDLGFKGYQYTWNNNRPGNANLKFRVDKVVATKEWRDKFQLSSITHISQYALDHLPIVLQTEHLKPRRSQGQKGFKFEESWLLWEECEQVVREAWAAGENDGHGLDLIQQKIKMCSEELRAQGLPKTNLNTQEMKQLQQKLEVLNMEETTEVSRAELLGVSKTLDD